MLGEIEYPEPDPNRKPPKQLWDERYAGESYLYGKEPIPFLKSYVGILKRGKVIDVAMGEGRNAVFLAKNGFNVTGLDASPRGVEKAKKLAEEKGTSFEAKVQNLDFFLMPLLGVDTILMTYFKPTKRFFSEILRGLTVGGTFLLEAHTVEHYKRHSKQNPMLDFESCYKPNEILSHLRNFRVLYYKEMQEGDNHLVQAIALKSQR